METPCPVSCCLHSKLFVVVHLGCSYLQISSNLKPTFTFLFPWLNRPSVGLTVATVKTNLIINLVMFFGISVHLPANFDGICPAQPGSVRPHWTRSTYFVPKCGARVCHYPGSPAPDRDYTKELLGKADNPMQDIINSHLKVTAFHWEINLGQRLNQILWLMTGSCNNQR